MFVLVACRPPDFGSAASSDALFNRLKACFEFTELFRARGAGRSPNALKETGTKLEQFKGIWREFGRPRPYSQQRRYSFIRRATRENARSAALDRNRAITEGQAMS